MHPEIQSYIKGIIRKKDVGNYRPWTMKETKLSLRYVFHVGLKIIPEH